VTIIEMIVFVFISFFIGFIAGIPVGATQFEMVRRAINGHLTSAILVVFGAVLSDAFYGIIAVFGLAPFLLHEDIIAVFWVINGVILSVIGIWAINDSKKDHSLDIEKKNLMANYRVSFITGISMAITNPMMIAWWILGSKLLIDTGIIKSFDFTTKIIFIISGSLGIFAYSAFLGALTYSRKKFISELTIKKIGKLFGYFILVLASYFFLRSILFFAFGKI
jgi:threonine/homoserine/homoserine lactone efflux protein